MNSNVCPYSICALGAAQTQKLEIPTTQPVSSGATPGLIHAEILFSMRVWARENYVSGHRTQSMSNANPTQLKKILSDYILYFILNKDLR